jgi:hypothetical protein
MIPKTMEWIPIVTKLGTISHAKGFVINKLFKQARFGGSHVPVQFLSQGYPLKWRHLIAEAVGELENEGIVETEPKRTGRSSAPHARLAKNALAARGVRGLLNAYRKAEGLPTLGRDLRTLLPVRRKVSAHPTR